MTFKTSAAVVRRGVIVRGDEMSTNREPDDMGGMRWWGREPIMAHLKTITINRSKTMTKRLCEARWVIQQWWWGVVMAPWHGKGQSAGTKDNERGHDTDANQWDSCQFWVFGMDIPIWVGFIENYVYGFQPIKVCSLSLMRDAGVTEKNVKNLATPCFQWTNEFMQCFPGFGNS